jgi:putrescine transport system substrate-binding protein
MLRILAPLTLTLAPLLASAGDVLTMYNWNDYIAPQVLVNFERETGIRVDYHTFSTVDELQQAIDSGKPMDIAVPSYDQLPALIDSAAILPLDNSQLPNRQYLDKELLSKLAAFDPRNRYAVPYLWGSVGLAINTVAAEKAFGGPLPESWSLLFDPAQSQRLASCGISVLNEPAEVLSAVMTYQGRSLTHSAPRQIKRAGELLQQLRPNLRYVDSQRYIDDLASGKLCLALGWVGDALNAAKAGQPVKFVIPQEGAALFMDTLVISKSAQRPDLAHKLINYLMQPKVAAQITSETLYPSANTEAKTFLAADLRDQQGLYPDRETKRRLAVIGMLPEQQKAARQEVWDNFSQGH